MKKRIFEYLVSVGLSPKHAGFFYLWDSIEYIIDLEGKPIFFIKLYAIIAQKHKKNKETVMKCMKNAVDCAILKCIDDNSVLFGLQSEQSGSVKLSEFIAFSSNYIQNPVEYTGIDVGR